MVSNFLFVPVIRSVVLPLLVSGAGHSANTRGELKERVDLIELNHSYDDQGRHKYDQVIFYEWSPDFRRFHVIDWCLVEDDENRFPRRATGKREYVVRWYDKDNKVHREIRSRLYRETWSCIDPERANKEYLAEKHRVSLMPLPKRTLY